MRLLERTFPRFRRFAGSANAFLNAAPERVKVSLAGMGDPTTWSHRQWEDFWSDWRAQAIPPVWQSQLMSVVPASFFQTPDWLGYANEIKGIQEFIRWTLYSYKSYPAAGSLNILFFDQTPGMATVTTVYGGDLATNMMDNGKMPVNEMFVGISLGVDLIPNVADVFTVNAAMGTAARDAYGILTNSWLEFKISGKEYLRIAPLTRLAPGHGPGSFFAAGTIAANVMWGAHLNNGSPDTRAKYSLDPPMGLLPGRPFEARIKQNQLQTIVTACSIGVGSDGWKIRAVL